MALLHTLSSKRRLLLLVAVAFIVGEMFLANRQRAFFAPSASSVVAGQRERELVEEQQLRQEEGTQSIFGGAVSMVQNWFEDKMTTPSPLREPPAFVQKEEEDEEGKRKHPLRDVLYPAEARIREFNMYQEDYEEDQEEVEEERTEDAKQQP